MYGRKYPAEHAWATWSAVPGSVEATTVAVGCRSAISRARFGPDTTAIRPGSAPSASLTTWLIRRWVPTSMPFIRLTRRACGGTAAPHADNVPRSACDGMARTTIRAPSSAWAGSVVAVNAAGSSTSPR